MVNFKDRNGTGLKCGPKAGFTLLELVMVTAIVILMAFIMVPYIAQNHEASSHKRDYYKLLAWAQWCQSRAITEQRYYQIVFDTVDKKYTIQRFDGVLWDDIETVYLEPSTFYVGITFPGNTLRFNHFGVGVDLAGVPFTENKSAGLRNREWYNATLVVFPISGRM